MGEVKYIILESMYGSEGGMIFSAMFTHAEMVPKGYKPVAAGFYNPDDGTCWGLSTSLGLTSREEDSLILKTTVFGASSF